MADPYAANPDIDDLRAASPAVYDIASREAPVPTLFPGGDVPAYTASGNPPRDLLKLPWQVRHAAAKADAAEWARLFREYAKGIPDADIGALFDPAAQDPANADYHARVSAWAMGPPPNPYPA